MEYTNLFKYVPILSGLKIDLNRNEWLGMNGCMQTQFWFFVAYIIHVTVEAHVLVNLRFYY